MIRKALWVGTLVLSMGSVGCAGSAATFDSNDVALSAGHDAVTAEERVLIGEWNSTSATTRTAESRWKQIVFKADHTYTAQIPPKPTKDGLNEGAIRVENGKFAAGPVPQDGRLPVPGLSTLQLQPEGQNLADNFEALVVSDTLTIFLGSKEVGRLRLKK
jgi:hypothetical protein